MKTIDLRLGNNKEVLPTLTPNSVDSIVCDPPYELSFMNAKWDSSGIANDVAMWNMCLAVLKPGGYLLAFGGSRTYHRMACAIEDAGFDIKDQIMWIYGCLSDDSEVLTEYGFMTYEQIRKSRNIRIFTYNKDTDSYGLEQPERWSDYQIKDTCYRIESDSTDQIVSRNHRCLVEREGKLVFEFAENIAQERQARVPVLESVPMLHAAIHDAYQRTSYQKQGLQQTVQQCVDWAKQRKAESDAQENTGGSLCGLREECEQANGVGETGEKPNLQLPVQRLTSGQRVGYPCSQGAGELVGSERAGAERAHDGRNESSLEGRDNLPPKEGLLRRGYNKVRSLSGRFFANGPKGWLRNGISLGYGPITKSLLEAFRSSASHRSQPNEQPDIQSDVVCQQQRPQKVRVGPSYNTTLATFTPIGYEGLVFCPTVSTGAFIARRNGKVFLTGNSGFPKSMDISKAFDKAAGADREVVGRRKRDAGSKSSHQFESSRELEFDVTLPSTDLAKQWDGWGTALKPAHEPIVVARKPFSGTIINNVSNHGTGAINIDGCRIPFASEADIKSATWGRGTDIMGGKFVGGFAPTGETNIEANPKGRWPANVIHDGNEQVLKSFPVVSSGSGAVKRASSKDGFGNTGAAFGAESRPAGTEMISYGDSGSAARFFYCAKADKKDRNEGTRRTPIDNTHNTVKPTDLMQYLCRLITPPGGVVLDPFMGSGSTGKAAIKEGFSFIGIELLPDHYAIAEARIKHAAAKYKVQTALFQ